MTLEWRRSDVAAPPDHDPGEPELVALIRDEIAAKGPITFARFMERALYEPGLGYYATSVARPGTAGDFVTAPELHPVFGWTIARQLDEMWQRMGRPAPLTLREYGAGSGALFLSILDGLSRAASPLAASIHYEPVDLPAQGRLIADRLAADGRHDLLQEPGDQQFAGMVLGNEFIDALPVHRVVQHGGRLLELFVEWQDEAFVEVAGEPSSDLLESWFAEAGVTLGEGQRAEVNLAMLAWIERVAADLERGYVIVIDYGADPRDLYSSARATGTLRAFSSQRVSSDVLNGVGRRDITAHVDFGTLERVARAVGLELVGRRRMAEFLLAAGLDEAYTAARVEADQDWDSALRLRGAVRRLLDPAALGGYQVLVLGRDIETQPALSGFTDAR